MKCPLTNRMCTLYDTYNEELCTYCGVTEQNQSGLIVLPTQEEMKQAKRNRQSYDNLSKINKKKRNTASPDSVTPIFRD